MRHISGGHDFCPHGGLLLSRDVVVSTRSRRESYAMHVRRMRRARECTLVTRGGRFTAHARRETARGMLGSTTGRSMLMLALMQVVVQCIIEYEYR